MVRLDHIELPVSDWQTSRNWYRGVLGFQVEMELPDSHTVGMTDDADLTIFMHQAAPPAAAPGLSFTIQVDDVDALYAELTRRGVAFEHPPRKVFWAMAPSCLTRTAIGCGCGTSHR